MRSRKRCDCYWYKTNDDVMHLIQCNKCGRNNDEIPRCPCHCHYETTGQVHLVFQGEESCSAQSCQHCQPQKPKRRFNKEKFLKDAESVAKTFEKPKIEAKDWEKDFDKWFAFKDGKRRRFAYADGVFDEVKTYIRQLIQSEQSKLITEIESAMKDKDFHVDFLADWEEIKKKYLDG